MFTKGQKVTLFQVWNGQTGSYTFRQAEVYSCGKKQMVLNAAENPADCLGRNFKPSEEQYSGALVLPAVSDAEARAIAFRLSAEHKAREAARYDNILSRTNELSNSYYVRGIERDRELIRGTMPAGMSRDEAHAVLKANFVPGRNLARYAD